MFLLIKTFTFLSHTTFYGHRPLQPIISFSVTKSQFVNPFFMSHTSRVNPVFRNNGRIARSYYFVSMYMWKKWRMGGRKEGEKLFPVLMYLHLCLLFGFLKLLFFKFFEICSGEGIFKGKIMKSYSYLEREPYKSTRKQSYYFSTDRNL